MCSQDFFERTGFILLIKSLLTICRDADVGGIIGLHQQTELLFLFVLTSGYIDKHMV